MSARGFTRVMGTVVVVLLGAIAQPGHAQQEHDHASMDNAAPAYVCPMHPEFVSDDPTAICPYCGMDLVPLVQEDGGVDAMADHAHDESVPSPLDNAAPAHVHEAPAQSPVDRSAPAYVCPMHPQFVTDDPEAICPYCGMDVVPLARTTGSSDIVVAPNIIQTMGVRVAPAQVTEFNKTLRAFGEVRADERLESVAVSRVEGWIEHLAVRAVGESVTRGDLLYRVFSPELVAAQKDWLNATASGNASRVKGARQRLQAVGMQQRVIDQLSQSGRAIEQVPVYAEQTGVVAALGVRAGDYIRPGTMIARLQSYATVWVIAAIPEQDLSQVAIGQQASLRFPSTPGRVVNALVSYLYPTIDPTTRTVEVRLEVDNADGTIRPGAYADIELGVAGGARLSVPTEAILRDSRGAHVIVSLGDGRFAGRAVDVGLSAGGRTEILGGLRESQLVVISGQFLLDSEVSLREGLSTLQPPQDDAPMDPAMQDHSGHR